MGIDEELWAVTYEESRNSQGALWMLGVLEMVS